MTDLARIIAAVAPFANTAAWSEALAGPMHTAGITTPNRIAMLLGQCAEETGDFRLLSEDLYYTTAERIYGEWRTHFADIGDAAQFVGRPAALANRVYANRMGNGSEESGDGWRFRGRGLIQITGRELYEALARVEPRAADPNWLTTPAGAAASACWYWTLPKPDMPSLNALSDDWNIRAVTQWINGGQTNFDVRERLVTAARAAFEDWSVPAPVAAPVAVPTPPAPAETTAQLNDAEYAAIAEGSAA